MVERGVVKTVATELFKRFPKKKIETQLNVFDWLTSKNDKRVSKNQAGYLVDSIRQTYAISKEFVAYAYEVRMKEEVKKTKKTTATTLKQSVKKRRSSGLLKESKIRKFWESMTEEERAKAEGEALSRADDMQRSWLKDPNGDVAKAVRKNLLDAYAIENLRT